RENPKRSRLSRIFSPLDKIKAELPGGVSVEGIGGIAESVHNLFHSVERLDFMQSERSMYLLPTPSDATASPAQLTRHELERLENELFDMTKYTGSCEYLTALAWAEEGVSGSITLFQVDFDTTTATSRRRERDVAVGIRPVAAMQGVPKPVLTAMRTHDKIKRKAVFVPTDDDAQAFKWRANPSPGPTYVRLEEDYHARHRHRHRSRSSSHAAPQLAAADGIRATIPQFVALLHANRAILEDVESSGVAPVETEEGDVVPGVSVTKAPRANSHEGDSVHVAVLMPNEAEWVDDEIVWTDRDGLVEFRRRRYWELIERGGERDRRRWGSRRGDGSRDGRHGSGSRDRSRDRSRSRHSGRSGDGGGRSRHLSPSSFF
ncbi:hypothetical protein B0T17DRAFT_500890, partial [Bombardia bombarda]